MQGISWKVIFNFKFLPLYSWVQDEARVPIRQAFGNQAAYCTKHYAVDVSQ